jgi:hypothetical protein
MAKDITAEEVAEKRGVDLTAMSETEKEALVEDEIKKRVGGDSESEEDEIGALILREEEEAKRSEKENAEKAAHDAEVEKERVERERLEAEKLEKIRENERNLLDKRSQPIRQYLMDHVVPYLTEGLIKLCKEVPQDPTDYLANFLLNKADDMDQELIRQREEEIRRKAAEKKAAGASPTYY